MKLNKEQKDVLKVMVKSLPKDLKFDSNAEKEICAVLYFKHLKNTTRDFTCGYKTIEAECGYTRHTISNYIKSLEAKKYIKHTQGSSGKNSKFELLFGHKDNMDNCPYKPTDNQNVTAILDIVDCPCTNDTQLDTKYKYKDKYKDKDNYYTTTNTILNNNSTNTKTTTTIDYSVLKDMIDRIIENENKINKLTETMNTMNTNCTATKELVTTLLERLNKLETATNTTNERLNVLETTVNTLVENNNILVKSLNEAVAAIKDLKDNKNTVQQIPAQTVQQMPVKTVQKMSVVEYAEKKEKKKKANERLNQLWNVVDNNSASMESRKPAVEELKELIKSDLISEKQKKCSQKKIDKFAKIESQQGQAKPKEYIDISPYWNKLKTSTDEKEKINVALELKRLEYDGKLTQGQIEGNKKWIGDILNSEAYKLEVFVEMCKNAKTNPKSCSLEELLNIVELRYQLNDIVHHTKDSKAAISINETMPRFRNFVLKDIVPYLKETFKANNMTSELERLEKATATPQYRSNNVNDSEQINTKTDDEVQLPNRTYEENIKDFTERYVEYMKTEANGEPINVDGIKKDYVETCRRLNNYAQTKESVITEYWLVADKEFRQYNIINSKIKRIA